MSEQNWLSLIIQAGGAVSVCGMFLWFLHHRQKHDEERDKRFFDQLDRQTAYLRDRDAQSKEIAMSGHAALQRVADSVREMISKLDVDTSKNERSSQL